MAVAATTIVAGVVMVQKGDTRSHDLLEYRPCRRRKREKEKEKEKRKRKEIPEDMIFCIQSVSRTVSQSSM